MRRGRIGKPATMILVLCLLLLPLMKPADAAVPKRSATKVIQVRTSQQHEIARIVRILGNGTGNRDLAERVRKKLEKLREEDVRLISNLCSQIEAGKKEPGADLAFAMVSALLVFL
jgi:hypothetical protein